VRIFTNFNQTTRKYIHEKAFDKMGGYLYHSHIQISKSF
jgi:hypothetical protein